jgi:broad specificity phosphatase PhoE
MNRLILVRHGGSTGNEDATFYNYSDSALCLTTNGIRQALNTGAILAQVEPRWGKPGNFALEVFVSEYFRTQQTCRIALDQMSLPSVQPRIAPLLNERDYGAVYDVRMDQDADYAGPNGNGETGLQAKRRVRGFLDETAHLLDRADVLAFAHFGSIRALVANLLDLSDAEMMSYDVPNGQAHAFQRTIAADGSCSFAKLDLPDHVLEKAAAPITQPPTPKPAPQVVPTAMIKRH